MDHYLIFNTLSEMHRLHKALRELGLSERPGFEGVATTLAALFTAIEAFEDNLRDVDKAIGGRANGRAVHGLVALLRAAFEAVRESAEAVDGLEPLADGPRAKADHLLAQLGAHVTFIERIYDAAWQTRRVGRYVHRGRMNAHAEHIEALTANLRVFHRFADNVDLEPHVGAACRVVPQILRDIEANETPSARFMSFFAEAAKAVVGDASIDPAIAASVERTAALIDAPWQVLYASTRAPAASGYSQSAMKEIAQRHM